MISPIQKLHMTTTMIPTMTRIPPSVSPPYRRSGAAIFSSCLEGGSETIGVCHPARRTEGLVLELPLRALRAVERELRRLVVGEVSPPAFRVGRLPGRLAFGATGDQ